MRTIHLIYGDDDFSDLAGSPEEQICLDLTIESVAPGLIAGSGIAVGQYRFLRVPWQQREHIHRSMRRLMDWYAEIGETEVNGDSLVNCLKVDERLSLWWLSSLSMKHLLRDPTIQLLAFAAHVENNPELREMLSSTGQRFRVRGGSERKKNAVRDCIRRLFPSATFDGVHNKYKTRFELRKRCARAPARAKMVAYSVRNLAWGVATELRKPLQTHMKGSANSTSIDVAICMFPTTWRRETDGQLRNRYWGQLPARISQCIEKPTIVPCSQGPVARRRYERTVQKDSPIDWSNAPEISPGTTGRILKLLVRMNYRSDRILRALQASGHTRFAGVDMADYIRHSLDKLFAQGGVEYLYLYFSLRDYFQKHPPIVALYRNEFYPTGRVVRAALPPETTAVGLQHGIVLPEHTVYSFVDSWLGPTPGIDVNYRWPPMPMKYLVYGDLVTEFMSDIYDFPEKLIIATGSPRHDEFFLLADSVPTRKRERSHAPFNLLIPGGLEASTRRWLNLGLSAARLIDDMPVTILVKPHWQFPMDRELSRLSDQHSNLQTIPVGDPLEAWYPKADAILVETSTTGLEAAIFGVPIISVVQEDGNELFPYVEEGAAIGVRNATQLATAISQCAKPEYREQWEPARQTFLRRAVSPGLGDAADRMIETIQSIIDQNR